MKHFPVIFVALVVFAGLGAVIYPPGGGGGGGGGSATNVVLTGDVTKPGNSTVTTLSDGVVTTAKISSATLAALTNTTTLHSQGLALSTELVAATNSTTLASQGIASKAYVDSATNSLGVNSRLVPLLPSDATKFLNGVGAFTVPAGGGGGGSQTPWLQPIDGGGYWLTNVSYIDLTGTDPWTNANLAGNGNGYWAVDNNGRAWFSNSIPAAWISGALPGQTNSIYGGTFGTNAQTGQTTIDAQGNISHTSTNQTFFALGREGTNGTPNLFKVDGTNGANGEVLAHGQGIMSVANALDYGADPTGATDSTAAIQRAIDSLGSTGGTAFIPRGVYNVTGTIHMRRNVTLQGEMSTYGGNGTQLSKTGTGATIMLAFTSCTLKNLHLVGQGVGNNQFGVISTNITDTAQSTTNWKMEDVKAEGYDVGFWIHNGWAAEMNTCYAQVCRDGILLSNTVDSIRIIGGEYQNCTNGIHFAGGNVYKITIECLMEVDVIGLLIEDDVAVDYNYNISVANCWFEGNPVNIDVTDIIQLSVINNTMSANAGGTNMIFRGGNRSSTIIGNEIAGACALHNAGSTTIGMLWENNYDSSTGPIVDTSASSIYVGYNGTTGGNIALKSGVFIGNAVLTTSLVPTNSALGGANIDFSSNETTTNAAGTIAYTGFLNFNPTNYNWKIIHILANGSDRTVTFPSNTRLPFPPACVVTNGTQKDVLVQLQQGVFTNVSWYATQ